MKLWKRSIQAQLLLSVLLLLILPIALVGGYLYNTVMSNVEAMENERIVEASKSTHILIEKYGASLMDITRTNSHWGDHRDAVEARDTTWLEENMNVATDIVPNLDFLFILDSKGQVLSQAGKVKDLPAKSIPPKDQFGLFETDQGLAILTFSAITDEAGTAPSPGTLVFGRLLDQPEMEEIGQIMGESVAILTPSGHFFTNSEHITKDDLVDAANDTYGRHEDGDAYYISSLQNMEGQPAGMVAVSQVMETSRVIKSDFRTTNGLIGLLLLVMLAGLMAIMYIRVVKPLQGLARVAQALGDNNLQQNVSNRLLERQDELGILGKSIQSMVDHLRSLLRQISETSHHLTQAASRLSHTSSDAKTSSEYVVAAMQEVAAGSQTQLQSSMETVQATEEMAKGAQSTAETIAGVSALSQEALSAAQTGFHLMQDAVGQMDTIQQVVHEAKNKVNDVQARSQEIDQISALITGVADQTNLLALNAAIEAARAGESGRGFAVVADEIRKLAEQTKASAQNIAAVVGSITQGSSESVRYMEQVVSEVQTGLTQVSGAGQTFEAIVGHAELVAQQAQDVSAVAEEMSASTEEISASMNEMAHIARLSTANAQTVSGASQEQAQAIEELSQSAEDLNGLAGKLDELMNRFKL